MENKNVEFKKQNESKKKADKAEKVDNTAASENDSKEVSESGGSWLRSNYIYILVIVALIVVPAVARIYYSGSPVSFPTFKNSYISASHVAVVVTFDNGTAYSNLSKCYLPVIENLARVKKLGTIDLYLLNMSNSTCTYSLNLGKTPINISNTTISACLSKASAEPGIYLNYSATNKTSITASKLVIYGNSAYMQRCPIAADIG